VKRSDASDQAAGDSSAEQSLSHGERDPCNSARGSYVTSSDADDASSHSSTDADDDLHVWKPVFYCVHVCEIFVTVSFNYDQRSGFNLIGVRGKKLYQSL